MAELRAWVWRRLVHLADRVAPDEAFRRATTLSFTFERNTGVLVHHNENRGCPLWYHGPDYHRAHDESLTTEREEANWRDQGWSKELIADLREGGT